MDANILPHELGMWTAVLSAISLFLAKLLIAMYTALVVLSPKSDPV